MIKLTQHGRVPQQPTPGEQHRRGHARSGESNGPGRVPQPSRSVVSGTLPGIGGLFADPKRQG